MKAHLAEPKKYNLDALRAAFMESMKISAIIKENERHEEVKAAVTERRRKSADLTEEIDTLENRKRKMLASAKFPIPELGLSDSGVTLNGLPFEQASSAEQLRASVAMGLAMNPKLKIMLIKDGSLLDENSLRMVAEMAEKADAQIWMERVGEGKETSVVIEDGAVKEEI